MEEDLTKLKLEELAERCNKHITNYFKNNDVILKDSEEFKNLCESLKTLGKLEQLDYFKELFESSDFGDKGIDKFLKDSIEECKESICYPDRTFSLNEATSCRYCGLSLNIHKGDGTCPAGSEELGGRR